MSIVECCKCFHHTRKLECRICTHKVCISCKPVKLQVRVRRKSDTSGLEPEQISDTPRSDAAAKDGWSGDAVCTSFEFTQTLERENARLQVQVAALRCRIRTLVRKLAEAKKLNR